MTDDPTLLRRYATQRAEDAFAELVRRHLPLVYSAAVRRLGGDIHRAEDVAQVVFCNVAREAHRLAEHAALTGWLYTATRNAVIDVVRAEQRRRTREEEARALDEPAAALDSPADWSRLRPVIDAAMDELNAEDREAVLLRFFEDQPFGRIGAALGVSEDAARKRVDRALDKLGDQLRRRKISSTAAALGALLASEAVAAVPAGVSVVVTNAALATGGAAVGAAAFLTATKIQWSVAALVLGGGAVGLVSQQRELSAVRERAAAAQQEVRALAAENARLAEANSLAATQRSQSNPRAPGPVPATASRPAPVASAGLPAADVSNLSRSASNPARSARIRRDVDGFVRQRGLTPEQADRLVAILSEWDDVRNDFQAAIRVQGLVWTPEAQRLRNRLQQQIENEPLTALLGEEGRRAYFAFEASAFHRALVEPVAVKLARANLALADGEINQLVALVKNHTRTIKPDPTSMGSEALVEWGEVIPVAAGFLSPAQIAVLQSEFARRTPTK